MKNIDTINLKNGLYKIYWKSGGSSLAAVGSRADGTKWIAPTNWTFISDVYDQWCNIQFIKKFKVKITKNKNHHITNCCDCGRFLKKDRWIRKNHPKLKRAFCKACLSNYDEVL